VFDLQRRPWIDPNADDPDMVAATVERCPSGALQYRRLDGGPGEVHASTAVVPMRNGPLLVTGEVRVRLEDGTEEVLPRATLCRCGGSARKPFCDNTHLKNGFQAPGELFKIRISPVRPRVEDPMTAAEDPRGAT
jgi:CDGSH-type Zn-finger protein